MRETMMRGLMVLTLMALLVVGGARLTVAQWPAGPGKSTVEDWTPQASLAGADGWVIECVDSKVFGGMTDRSLRLDDDGHPHIAYGGNHLYYAYYDGASWHYEMVDDSPRVGCHTSLALDERGYPHIGYQDATNWDLKYAYQDASGWHIETVDSEARVRWDTSLALDGGGYPHISYFDEMNGDLQYAYQDASGWHIETVDSEGIVGWDTSLALDGGGYPHISYFDYTNGDLKYAYQDASGWHIQTVDSAGYVGWHTSLALDGDGYPHISYQYCGTSIFPCNVGDLKYAYQDASGWHIEIVDSEGYVGYDTSLALDGGGYPHISYYDYTNGDLKYAYQDIYGWHIETVDSEGYVGLYTSLALDGDGYPHISYFDCTWPIGKLKYAYRDASGWHTETVDSEARVGYYTSLALDGDGYPHISYYDDTNGDLKYAYQDDSSWHIEIVDSEGVVGEYISLALEGDGYPHISYLDRDNANLRYAYQDDSGWHIETVDTHGDVGGFASLALDESGYPHISYYDDTDGDLKYAYQDDSGWHIETVDSNGDVGKFTSLALDERGYLHISYYRDYPNYGLKYAYQDASGWHIETVDNEGDVGRYTSLALDGDGYPHISYYDDTDGDLKYAYLHESGWHIETVDSEGYVGWYTSLALDERGYPHISYYDHTNGDLKYAYLHESGWHIETVDSEGNAGYFTSLALNGGGYPHVSYYDLAYKNLKYAYYSGPPLAPTLHAISNPDGDGDYTVDWSDVTGAITYTLQEDDTADFTTPTTRYSGSYSQYTVSGQAAGTWYYRVKASNTAGDSPWSNVESVTVQPSDGDDYEPDDICTGANPISTDGSSQSHTFHQYADKDWVYFTATSGTTYIIQTSNVGPDADTILELHDECELPPIAEDENPFGTTAQIIWTAPADGTYYLKVYNHDPDQYGADAYYDLSIRTQPAGGAAIIVAGHDDGYRLQSNIYYCTNRAYEVFASGGIPVGNIYYLTPDEANPYQDDDSTSANLQYAITTWSAGKVGPGVPLYLYLMDHGGLDTFLINGSADTISPANLDTWLTTLEQTTGADTINVFIEACRSGSFIDGWQEVAGPGRVVIASTSRDRNAYASTQGAYFSDVFFTAVGESKDLCESFREGEMAVKATGLRQEPWIDDDGDAIPNEPEDCGLAQRRGLAAFFGDRPPVIDAITVPARIEGYVGTIKAQVRDDVRVDDVWAVIYPPSFEEPAPTDTMPELDLTSIKLLDLDGDGEYTGTYTGFTEVGEYHIVVYAEDDEGDQATPKGADVRRGWEVYLPSVVRAK